MASVTYKKRLCCPPFIFSNVYNLGKSLIFFSGSGSGQMSSSQNDKGEYNRYGKKYDCGGGEVCQNATKIT